MGVGGSAIIGLGVLGIMLRLSQYIKKEVAVILQTSYQLFVLTILYPRGASTDNLNIILRRLCDFRQCLVPSRLNALALCRWASDRGRLAHGNVPIMILRCNQSSCSLFGSLLLSANGAVSRLGRVVVQLTTSLAWNGRDIPTKLGGGVDALHVRLVPSLRVPRASVRVMSVARLTTICTDPVFARTRPPFCLKPLPCGDTARSNRVMVLRRVVRWADLAPFERSIFALVPPVSNTMAPMVTLSWMRRWATSPPTSYAKIWRGPGEPFL
ncbi:hypothetical protein BC835DRAFT_670467 [Cytidiella melzeri]|nr:hypothetical protein BC835DRAFT_670467 [Cytidiella melzeri]